jgi:hypothetical protein
MDAKRSCVISLTAICFVLVVIATVNASVIYDSRVAFDTAIGTSITDTYSTTDYGTGFIVRTNAQMDAVFGETRYIATGIPNFNIVASEGILSRAYCAGCNGSFILDFTDTTIGSSQGLYGVGFDYINGGAPPTYDAFITFGGNSTLDVPLNLAISSADFFGVTSSSLISSIALGLPDGGATTSGSFAETNPDVSKG